jgi:hypothetical protein
VIVLAHPGSLRQHVAGGDVAGLPAELRAGIEDPYNEAPAQ